MGKRINKRLFDEDEEENNVSPVAKLFETEAMENDEEEDDCPKKKQSKKVILETPEKTKQTLNLFSMGFFKSGPSTTTLKVDRPSKPTLSTFPKVVITEKMKVQDKKEIQEEETLDEGEGDEVDSHGNLVDASFIVQDSDDEEEEEEQEVESSLVDEEEKPKKKIKLPSMSIFFLQWPKITAKEKEVMMDFVVRGIVPKNIDVEMGVIDKPLLGLPIHFFYRTSTGFKRLYTILQFPITEIKFDQVGVLKRMYAQFSANPTFKKHELWLVCLGNHRAADQKYQNIASNTMVAWLSNEIPELKVVIAYMDERKGKKRTVYYG